MTAQRERESRGIAILSFSLMLDGVGGQRQAPVDLPQDSDLVPILLEAGWVPGPNCVVGT